MMTTAPPFVDRESGTLDLDQIWVEAFPLIGLIVLFGSLALVPFLGVVFIGGNSLLGILFTVLSQFVLAVGTGIVLLYLIARGIQLAEDDGRGTAESSSGDAA